MAFLSTTDLSTDTPSIFASVFGAIGNFFMAVMEAQDRSEEVQKLQAMSDIELTELGIDREDIVRHVFRSRYYA